MPHLRERHLEQVVKKALSFSPITAVLGHRQVGKTTILEKICRSYKTFDQSAILGQAESDPERFLAGFTQFPVGLDECQLVTPLFPALKEAVRVRKSPGQFLLSGSVRFASRKEIRESLTGRILLTELFPMTASETAKLPQARLLTELMLAKDTNAVTKIVKKAEQTKTEHCKLLQRAFDTSLHSGGLPGVFFARNIQMRRLKWESQLETILIRDLELISKTTLNYQSKRETLAELARNQGSPLDYKELARKVRISAPTLKKLLIAFEALFLIRIIPCEGGEKRPSFFLEDQGEAQHLTDLMIDERSSFTNALYMHLRVPFMTPLCNLEHTSRVFQFRTRGGAYIPFAFQNGSKALGIIPGLDETPSRIDLASAKSFLNCFKEGIVIYIHPHKKLSILGEGLIQMPVNLSLS